MQENTWKLRFFTIAAGQTVSLVGSSAVQFALIWWIASETESAMMLGFSGLAAFLPAVLFGPVAGILADKVSRKAICIGADLFMGISAAIFAAILWAGSASSGAAIWILLLRGVGNTFHQPSIQAIIPQIVPQGELTRANGWTQFMQSGAFMIAPVLGAALYAALPMPVILLTDLAGAAVASGLLAIVRIPRLKAEARQKQSFSGQLREGAAVFLADRRLLVLLAAQTVGMLFYLPLASLYPLMTSSYFQASAWHGSAVELAYALGMMLSAALFGSVIQVRSKLRASYLGMLGLGATAMVCGLLPPHMWAWWIFLFVCGFMGAFGNVHSIPLMAYMQETIAPEKMGRAFALLSMVGSLAMPLGLLIAGPVAEQTGVHMWFLISGVGIAAATVAGMMVDRYCRL